MCCRAGARADEQAECGIGDARSTGRLRDRPEYRKPERKRAKRATTGLAPEGQNERSPLSNHKHFHCIPSRAKRGSSEDEVYRQRVLSRLSHLRGRKIRSEERTSELQSLT